MIKKSLSIAGHRTSVALEAEFWTALDEIAKSKNVSGISIFSSVDKERETGLASAMRVYILNHYKNQVI